MGENTTITMPAVVYESHEARNEREKRRLWIVLLLSVFLVFISNAVWLWAWLQYDYSTETTEETYTVDLDTGEGGDTNYVGRDGGIYYGEGESYQDQNHNSESP